MTGPRAIRFEAMGTEDNLVGRVLGEFVVRTRMARGGGGTTYLAEQPRLKRHAVVKVLLEESRADERLKARFLREVRLASHIDHPYAAHIYSFGAEPDGVLWIAMEYVRGTALSALLAKHGPLPPETLVPFVESLAEVIDAIHEEGIIHRDVKPANVMVIVRSGRMMPKLLDLGVAVMMRGAPTRPESAIEWTAPLTTPASAPPFDDTGTQRIKRRSVPTMTMPPLSPDDQALPPTMPPPPPAFAAPRGDGALEDALDIELTSDGEAIGSPAYMAPEQWLAGWAVDRRTDVYALGVLVYQCIAGHVPFKRKDEFAMATAHTSEEPPPLPASTPAPLARAILKALSKNPSDRYPTTLAFGNALRVAWSESNGETELPTLPLGIRRDWLASAPQPIAECMATLDGARTAPEAMAAVRQLVSACTRYLVVLAIAIRGHTHAPLAADAPSLAQRLRPLWAGKPSHAEWCALLETLSSPWRARGPESPSLPLADLVALGQDADVLRELTALGSAPMGGIRPDACASLLRAALPRLQALLETLSPVLEYPWVLVCGDRAEKWAGTRTARRPVVTLASKVHGDGEFFVLDAFCAPLVRLSPVVQALTPTPGEPPEAFWLEGNGRRGARLSAVPARFERQDASLLTWLEATFRGPNADDADGPTDERAPYRGLASFTAADADNFYGREREAEAFANRLRVHGFLAVVGPSGVGKSSFVQAGVVPLLAEQWRVIVLRPGNTPAATLGARLAAELSEVTSTPDIDVPTGDGPERGPTSIVRALVAAAERSGSRILLVIDQFEEVITLCQDETERQAFADALAEASSSTDHPMRVVVTLRDDFLIATQSLIALREKVGEGLQLLATPAIADMFRILVEPLKRVGYSFEDDDLPAQMVAEVSETPGALALLSFAASKLWEDRDTTLRRLTRKAYQGMGGVGGALAHHAEDVLVRLPVDAQALVRETFRHLVSAQGTRSVVSRTELYELFGVKSEDAKGPATTLIGALVDARLLVTSESEDNEDRIEIIHEALISSWPRLVQWLREDAESLRMRDALRTAARQWEGRRRARGLLWRDEALLEYRVWRARYVGHLARLEDDFATASLRADARARTIRRGLGALAFAILAIGVVLLYRSGKKSEASARLAERKSAEALESLAHQQTEQARQMGLFGEPLEAYPYAVAALTNGADTPAARFVIGHALALAGAQMRSILLPVQSIATTLLPDKKRLVVGTIDGRLLVVSTATWTFEPEVDLGWTTADRVVSAFPPARSALIAACGHGETVRLLDATTLSTKHSVPLEKTTAYRTCALFDDDASLLVVESEPSKYVVFRRTASGAYARSGGANLDGTYDLPLVSPDGHTALLYGGGVGTRGDRVVLFSSNGEPQVVRVGESVRSAVFTADSSRIVMGTQGGSLAVARRDAKGAWHLGERKGPYGSAILGVTLSEARDRIAGVFEDGALKIWTMGTLEPIASNQVHTRAPRGMLALRDGQRVATFGSDKRVVLSSVLDGSYLGELAGPAAAFAIAGELDDGALYTVSLDRTLRVWSTSYLLRTTTCTDCEGTSSKYFFDEPSRRLYQSNAGTLVARDPATFAEIARYPCPMTPGRRFFVSRDGRAISRVGDETAKKYALAVCNLHATPVTSILTPVEDAVDDLTIAPNGEVASITFRNGKVFLWDFTTDTKREIAGSNGIASVAFSSDGARVLIVEAHGASRVLATRTGAVIAAWTARDAYGFPARLSADGALAAISYGGGVVKIHAVAENTDVASIDSGSYTTKGVGWLQNGDLFYSAGAEGAIHLWDARTWVELAHERVAQGASYAETFSTNAILVGTPAWLAPIEFPYFTADRATLARPPCPLPYALDRDTLVTRPPKACRGPDEDAAP